MFSICVLSVLATHQSVAAPARVAPYIHHIVLFMLEGIVINRFVLYKLWTHSGLSDKSLKEDLGLRGRQLVDGSAWEHLCKDPVWHFLSIITILSFLGAFRVRSWVEFLLPYEVVVAFAAVSLLHHRDIRPELMCGLFPFAAEWLDSAVCDIPEQGSLVALKEEICSTASDVSSRNFVERISYGYINGVTLMMFVLSIACVWGVWRLVEKCLGSRSSRYPP